MNMISLFSSASVNTPGALGNSWSNWLASQMSSFTPLNVAAILLSGLVVGVLISLVYSTPVGSTVVGVDICAFLIFCALAWAGVGKRKA